MTSPPHVLLLCWGFPPFRGSGVHRPLALANALAGEARVTVVAASRECFLVHYGADVALEQQVDPRVRIVRVPFAPEHAWPLVNDWPRRRAEDPRAFVAALNARQPLFPERVYVPWLNRAYEAALAVHSRDPVQAIVASGAPYVDLEAGTRLAATIQVPLFLDDRDAFLADVFTGAEHRWYTERLPYFRVWARQARELWFVNPVIAAWHAERFEDLADRIAVVENGWDPGIVAAGHRPATGPLAVGYVGLVPTNFPLATVLAGWQQVPDRDATAQLRFVGPLGYEVGSRAWTEAASQIEAAPGVDWLGHVSRTELASVYAELDVLLLAKEGGAMVTGGKTYEYAATGLPIAALIDPGSDAVRVLRDYPRLHLAPTPDAAGIAAALAAAMADARQDDDGSRRAAARRAAATLTREHALAPAVARVVASAA